MEDGMLVTFAVSIRHWPDCESVWLRNIWKSPTSESARVLYITWAAPHKMQTRMPRGWTYIHSIVHKACDVCSPTFYHRQCCRFLSLHIIHPVTVDQPQPTDDSNRLPSARQRLLLSFVLICINEFFRSFKNNRPKPMKGGGLWPVSLESSRNLRWKEVRNLETVEMIRKRNKIKSSHKKQ